MPKMLYLSYSAQEKRAGDYLTSLMKDPLTQAGWTIWSQDETDYRLGWREDSQQHLLLSSLFVPLVSQNYLEDVFCQFEWEQAFLRAQQGKLSLQPILLEEGCLWEYHQVALSPFLAPERKGILSYPARKQKEVWKEVALHLLQVIKRSS